jgi:hypothetical protein
MVGFGSRFGVIVESQRAGQDALRESSLVVTSVDGWVWDYNVHLFMSHVARAIGHSYDDLDRGAVEAGLAHTDVDEDEWFDFPLVGRQQLTAHLARNSGASPVMFRVVGEIDDVLRARVETIIDVLYDVHARH